jgi:hypothetical protein
MNSRVFRGSDDPQTGQGGAEPPSRLLVASQITPTFSYDPDLMTELEVRFIAEAGGTRVELEHRLDGYGPAAENMFKVFDGGWQGLVESFAKEVA